MSIKETLDGKIERSEEIKESREELMANVLNSVRKEQHLCKYL